MFVVVGVLLYDIMFSHVEVLIKYLLKVPVCILPSGNANILDYKECQLLTCVVVNISLTYPLFLSAKV